MGQTTSALREEPGGVNSSSWLRRESRVVALTVVCWLTESQPWMMCALVLLPWRSSSKGEGGGDACRRRLHCHSLVKASPPGQFLFEAWRSCLSRECVAHVPACLASVTLLAPTPVQKLHLQVNKAQLNPARRSPVHTMDVWQRVQELPFSPADALRLY
jgi:hypothetical protein